MWQISSGVVRANCRAAPDTATTAAHPPNHPEFLLLSASHPPTHNQQFCAYAGNILGCALMLAIFTNTGLLPQLTKGAEAMALYKTAAPFKEVGGWEGP